ncbi:hypothetical protein AB0E62_37125 [Streptomyces sp. NPDC038707]|uniref:hypothetical protein n=1 Tax=Streptomyces sp. NPDC038707 TaxID=3154329 RepID=UPI00340102DA
MNVVINPGTGPIPEATEEQATKNMTAFLLDLRTRDIPAYAISRRPATRDYGDGRYAYLVHLDDGTSTEVQMPGLPLDQVRWLGADGQDIWQFPRLYVDDSSWIWYFALNCFEPDDAPSRQPNGTVQGGEPYVFTTIRLGGDER